jgi:hypothetical protein
MKGKLTSLQKHISHSTSPRAVKGVNTPHPLRDHGPTLAVTRAIQLLSGTTEVRRG